MNKPTSEKGLTVLEFFATILCSLLPIYGLYWVIFNMP